MTKNVITQIHQNLNNFNSIPDDHKKNDHKIMYKCDYSNDCNRVFSTVDELEKHLFSAHASMLKAQYFKTQYFPSKESRGEYFSWKKKLLQN